MKGAVVNCLQGLITRDYGEAKWKESLKAAGMKENAIILASSNVPDADVIKVMKSSATVTGLSMDQLTEKFGEYWSTTFAPGMYGLYFKKAKNAKELLLNLDAIHVQVTKSMAGAAPPRFTYESPSEKELIMHYSSPRGLVGFMPSMIRGLGKYYKEKVDVQLKGNDLHIRFG